MNYKTLYRKFRPITFDEVEGQAHVLGAIKNQILTNTIGHAYIFSGIRGTGKTTIAKIFARAVNCTNKKDQNPCNQCENCLAALNDKAIDIMEIDAASNNSVDDVRELRENVKYAPANMKYKVYIIDEVHMLSKGAFNALLKTIEEPPEHVLFIFATTELNQLPDTIISRCQSFEFKRLTNTEISNNLRKTLNGLNREYDEEILEEIADISEGALRDALSILEKCVLGTSGKITSESISSILGLAPQNVIVEILGDIFNDNPKDALIEFNKLLSSGKDAKRIINQLVKVLRYILLLKVSRDINELLDLKDEFINKLISISKNVEIHQIIDKIDILIDVIPKMKYSSNERLLAEISIIKMCDEIKEEEIIKNSEKTVEENSCLNEKISSDDNKINLSNEDENTNDKSIKEEDLDIDDSLLSFLGDVKGKLKIED